MILQKELALSLLPKSTIRVLCKCDNCGTERSIAKQDLTRRGGEYTLCQKCTVRNQGYKNRGKKHSEETKNSMSLSHKRNKNKYCFKKGHTPWNKGLTSDDQRVKKYIEKGNLLRKDISGSKNPNWKGGISSKEMIDRKSKRYSIWREKVFLRDNYVCQVSGQIGGKLEAHHLIPFSKNKDCRFIVLNGITMSKSMHRLFHKKYGKIDFDYKDFLEFKNEVIKNYSTNRD